MRWKRAVTLALPVFTSGCGGCNDRNRRDPAGRIPSCESDGGIDLFAAEGDEVLGLSWNNVGGHNHAGGYRIRYGLDAGSYSQVIAALCSTTACEQNVAPLANGTLYFLVVDALDGTGAPTVTSCEVAAMPHVLVFGEDARVNDATGGTQSHPDIAVQGDGHPIFVAWEDGGAIRMARSDDLGDSWSASLEIGSGANQAAPAVAFRHAWLDGVERPILLFAAYEQAGSIHVARIRFPGGSDGGLELDEPISVGQGVEPDIALTGSMVHVAWEDAGQIYAVASSADVLAFGAPVRVDTGSGTASRPAIAADIFSGHVYVGFHAIRGAGDANAYANVSTNGGLSFRPSETRVDDDRLGQNQTNLSLTVDHDTGIVLATWEDRRGGANVYFSRSADGGLGWEPNVQTGAGLGGDQFVPSAAADPGRNVYVLFVDTTNGRRPLFSRFNPSGTFDAPLPVSTQAGIAGASADDPAVAIDSWGTVYAVWTENRSSPDVDVYFARAE